MKTRVVAAVVVLMLTGNPLDAGERITLQVSPSVAFEPANLVVRTRIEANEENRSMEIIAESVAFYRSSEFELDGERAPRTTRIEFRALPSGLYHVRAVLKGSSGREIASVQHNVNVMEGMRDTAPSH